jgi:MFS transporter, FHS family, glucose/mannose:H+ symporter
MGAPRRRDGGDDPGPDPGPGRRQRLALLLVGVAGFVSVGALQASFGPSFAALQERYGVSIAQVGAIVSAYFAGAFVGVLGSGALLGRLGYRRSLISAALLVAAGAAVIGTASTWLLALAAAFVAGLGFGQATVGVNLMVARAYGRSAPAALNALNGTYSLGAVLGPALVAVVTARFGPSAEASAVVFGAVSLCAIVFLVGALRLRWLPIPRRPARGRVGVPAAAVLLFMVMFFLYVATEASTPAWIPTHLRPQLGAANAALVASGFWTALALGRFLVTPIAARLRPRDLVLGAAVVTLVGLLLAQAPGLAVPGYVLAGFGLAPVFPTTIAWLLARFGDRGEQVTPLVIAAGNLGPVLGTPLVGVIVAATSVALVPTALAGLAALMLAAVTLTWLSGRNAEAASQRPAGGG